MQKKWVSILAGGAMLFSATGIGFAQGESGGAGTSGGAASGGATSGGATSVAPAPEAAAPPPEALPPGPAAPAPVAVAGIEPIWIVGGALVTAGIICAIVCGGHSTTTTGTH